MLHRSSLVAPAKRSGVVLLVVMAMLALFASLALSFVFYADNEAESAGYSRMAQTIDAADIDPEELMGYFLSNLIYDTNNPYSAGRGWGLARSIYGYNPAALNFTPYNGTGRNGPSSTANVANSFAPKTVPDPNIPGAVPMYNLINYQTFYTPGQATVVRTPEFYGSTTTAGPPTAQNFVTPNGTFRYAGGANPPWTAYDLDNLFLAEMAADGTLILPSFGRPWNAPTATQAAAAKYMSVFPDPTWNPAFFPLPDTDFSGMQVKNNDFGPGGNDSNWMDWGHPVMTAPNGKRYKPLFAPLIVDLSNRLHLWAHGNNLGGSIPAAVGASPLVSAPGVSNQGFGPSEVNLNALPGVRTLIAAAAEGRNGTVTVTTATPHGLTAGQTAMVTGVNASGYDGVFKVLTAPTPTTFTYQDRGNRGAPTAGNGYVYNLTLGNSPLMELQALMNLRYTGTVPANLQNYIAGVPGSPMPTLTNVGPGPLTTFPWNWANAVGPVPASGGRWYSMVNANGLDQSAADATFNMSNTSPYLQFNTSIGTAVAGKLPRAHTVKFLPNLTASTIPWAIEQGMSLTIDFGTANQESVTVTSVNYAAAPPTFTATFAKTHAVGASVIGGFPGFPTYPGSWLNGTAAELANNPLAFNLFLPNAPSIAPLQASNMEALLRWGGTNSPALTSSIFKMMPNTFAPSIQGMRSRNMVTLSNWYFDRITSSPYLNFNRNSAATEYAYLPTAPGSASYPVVGNNEVQSVTVTGPTGGTFNLQLPGQKATAAIKLTNKIKSATIQRDLKATLPAGGTAKVGAVTVVNNGGTPAVSTYTFTVSFGGTLSNLDVPQLTGTGLTGTPLPTVAVKTLVNGQAAAGLTAPNLALAATIPTVGSDFTGDWRSAVSQALRVDLTRPLREYPAPGASGVITNTAAGSPFDLAQKDRQQFALDLYNALVRVTGARDPNALTPAGALVNPGMQPTATDYQAARWLAQFAVNIVDFIDDDDYMTPFPWNQPAFKASNGGIPLEYLFGTELPRLVLNEGYVQMEPQTTAGQTPTVPVVPGQVNVWAELFNPFKQTPAGSAYPLDGGNALLQYPGNPNPVYTIEIYQSSPALTTALQSANNPTGAAPAGTMAALQSNWTANTAASPLAGVTTSAQATQMVQPANGATGAPSTISIMSATIAPPSAMANKTGVRESAKGIVTIRTLQNGPKAANVGQAVTITGVQTIANQPVPAFEGTFIINSVISANEFTVISSSPAKLTQEGFGTVYWAVNAGGTQANLAANQGFYVVGPQAGAPLGAQFTSQSRNPGLPVTYAPPAGVAANGTPLGMTFNPVSLQIAANTNNGVTNGTNPSYVSAGNPTGVYITVQENGAPTAAQLAAFVPGALVFIQGVTTTAAAATVQAVGYNNTIANPAWIIETVAYNAKANTFSFTAIPNPSSTPPAVAPAAFSPTPSGNGTATIVPTGVTLLLRRLANPHLPYNATTNPYITVDYLDGLPVNAFAPAVNQSVGRNQPYSANPVSWGLQIPPPGSPLAAPTLPNPPQTTFFSQNSNATFPFDWLVHLDRPPVNPIEITHVSGYRPHELTQQFVTANGKFQHYAPWNPFALSAATPTGTMADPNALIYRALDQMSTRYMAGLYTGGRFPGNINLNTITEYEIFQALCDAHDATAQYPNAWFTQNDVALAFMKLVSARENGQFFTGTTTAQSKTVTAVQMAPPVANPPAGLATMPQVGNLVMGFGIPPGTTVAATPPPNPLTGTFTLSQPAAATGSNILIYSINPAGTATPFKSFSAASTAQTAAGNTSVSFNDTWYRPDPMNPTRPLFVPNSAGYVPGTAIPNANAHPYWQSSLLQKIYNNITTTSNVFAVWWTVGFFEVVDESVKPARLGQEIGRSQNRHVRHRFFAIVDRSGLQLFKGTASGTGAGGAITLNAANAIPQSQTVTISTAGLSNIGGAVGPWSATTAYSAGSIVTQGGVAYICTQGNTGQTPAAGSLYWQPALQPGMLLEVDVGSPLAEVVAVQTVNGMTFTANFTNSHAANVPIICRGNPGPRGTYNPHDDRGVVLHMSVIK